MNKTFDIKPVNLRIWVTPRNSKPYMWSGHCGDYVFKYCTTDKRLKFYEVVAEEVYGYPEIEYREVKGYITRCTGAKDRNSKLIWEGDIVICHHDSTHFTSVIELNDCGGLPSHYKGQCEVIGNMFQNPELI